ncbi:hypothetical protein H4R24_000388 [Coemansia sp. RSA 988]|nr:hypothetical protein H4R24_000388 [Coemansia sp. RSA 988]
MTSLFRILTSVTTYWLVVLALAQTISAGWFHREPTKTTNHHDIRQLRTVHEMITIEEQITAEEQITVEELVTVQEILIVEEDAYNARNLFARAPASPTYGNVDDIMKGIAAKNAVPHDAGNQPKGTTTVIHSVTGKVPTLGNADSIMVAIKAAGLDNDGDNNDDDDSTMVPTESGESSDNDSGSDKDTEDSKTGKDTSPSPTDDTNAKYTPCASYTTVEGITITFADASSCPVDAQATNDPNETDDNDSEEDKNNDSDSNCEIVYVTLGTNVVTFGATGDCKPTGSSDNPYELGSINPYVNDDSPSDDADRHDHNASTDVGGKDLGAKPIMGEMGYGKGNADKPPLKCTADSSFSK